MNRDSWLISFAKLIMSLPWEYLHPLEKLSLKPFRRNSFKKQPVFILAIPRSGSTLAFQCLTHKFKFTYFNNLWHFFSKLPFWGGLVSFIYLNLVNPASSFTSNQGFVSGVVGPAEGLNFWSYWFNFNLSDKFSSSKNHPLKSNKPFYLIKVLKSLSKISPPFCSAYLGHSLYVKQLKEFFPKAIFIRIKRDPLDNALSLLSCLRKSKSSWFSVHPRECKSYAEESEYSIVASQVYWLAKRLDMLTSINQSITIAYEDLCKNPEAEMLKIQQFASLKGLKLQQRFSLPSSFPRRSSKDYDSTDVHLTTMALKGLVETYGPI